MKKLEDKFGRQITYLRLSMTDRCNLRCSYCMPERGTIFAPKKEILSYEEMLSLAEMLGELGIRKIRITGGEPFVRNDLIYFLKKLTSIPAIEQVSITSNLTLIRPHLFELLDMGIANVNVSLDALDRTKFHEITRRDMFEEVERTLMEMIDLNFHLKINCVAMAGKNEDQFIPLMELARKYPVSVRFLEEMPFNGSGEAVSNLISYKDILRIIGENFAYTKLIDEQSSTSMNYYVEGFKGNFGIIPSFSRTFCGDCNRLRLSATGEVRTCLYGGNELNLRDLLRSGASKNDIQKELITAVDRKPTDGFAAAEQNEQNYLSMTKLGG